jgi:serine/threonine protein kinase
MSVSGGNVVEANASLRNRLGAKFAKLSADDSPDDVKATPEELQIRRLVEPEQLSDMYQFDEQIYDAGDRSKVFLATERSSGEGVVVKMRLKGFFNGGEPVWRQVLTRIMNLERNENILGVDCVLEDNLAYYVVMRKCGGGELFDFLLNATDVPEKECKRIMREILKAVDHLHSRGIIHRDIKPENVLFNAKGNADGSDQASSLKLIDFDTCQDWSPKSPKARCIVGTPGYIAPESFKGNYTPSSDLWSVGVILYILMTGEMPFPDNIFGDDIAGNNQVGGRKTNMIYDRLKNCNIDWERDPWPEFPSARDLCQQLLAFDPGDRSPSAAEALNHPWLVE